MRLWTTLPIALAAVVALPAASASADRTTGGMAASDGPRIAGVRCIPLPAAPCPEPAIAPTGGQIQVRGRDMHDVRTVTFRGGAGKRDDVTVRARHVRPTHVEAVVPARARSGRVEIRGRYGVRAVTEAPLEVVKPQITPTAAAPSGDQVFPIRGKHDLGQTETNNFGGGRNHQGQDLFAKCGTPMVVAEGGTVVRKSSEGNAGNHAVIRGAKTGRDYVYMHLQSPALVEQDQSVTAGQPLGAVGDTGNASGCHLHFEIWSAPGWYEGGSPLDPLADLRAWDARDGAHGH
jgi:murein DD-endopeptidase MepM/ murein hydrolase activator NlpD